MIRKTSKDRTPLDSDIEKELSRSGRNEFDLTPPPTQESEDWLMTYTDLVTLLITLFIVMVAHASFNKEIGNVGLFELTSNVPPMFKDAPNGLSKIGKPFDEPPKTIDGNKKADERPEDIPPEDIQANAEKMKRAETLKQAIQRAGMEDAVAVEVIANEIELKINDNVLFPSARADLSDQGISLLSHILPTLQEEKYQINVEGHTDNVQISTDRFPSNWELSAARALSVVHYFESQGVPPETMQATAYGETRPMADNSTEEGRRKNRRVQLVLR